MNKYIGFKFKFLQNPTVGSRDEVNFVNCWQQMTGNSPSHKLITSLANTAKISNPKVSAMLFFKANIVNLSEFKWHKNSYLDSPIITATTDELWTTPGYITCVYKSIVALKLLDPHSNIHVPEWECLICGRWYQRSVKMEI